MADCDPELADEVDGHGGGELGALAEFDDELFDGHVDGDGEVEGELGGALEVGGAELVELLGECDGDRGGLLEGDGERLGCLWCRCWCRLPTPGGGPGFTGGSVGLVPGPGAPVPGATGTTTPAPAAYSRSIARTRLM